MIRTVRAATVALALALASIGPATVSGQETETQHTCEQGPIKKTIGGTEWSVYSCTDDLTLVFIAAEGSPAHPFLFILYPENGMYALHSEGTGNQDATKAAHDDILKLDANEIRALIEETKQEL